MKPSGPFHAITTPRVGFKRGFVFKRIFLLFSILGVLSNSFGNSSNHSHFIDENGSLWGTGYNSNGQIGNGGTDTLLSPVKIVDGNLSRVSVIQVSSGYRHTVFLKSDGTVWAMGLNDSGQLGDGTFDQRISPVQVSGLAKVAQVTAGHGFSLFVTQTGELWGTGSIHTAN